MSVYFKPLRRKFGIAALLFAGIFAVGWVRSLNENDSIESGDWMLISNEGVLSLGKKVNTYQKKDGTIALQATTALQRIGSVPYYSIAIPLTLMAAWLLTERSKRRKQTSESSV